MDHLSFGSLGLGVPSSPNTSRVNETAPQLIHQSAKSTIYRLKERGIKVSLDPDPTQEELIRKLLHEQNISKFLPPSCSKRTVIDVTTFNRTPALIFEWVNGITLKKWLTTGDHLDLDIRLRASMAIAKTLSDFHEGGVVYNSLSPENIVLETCGNEFVATFIDLSEALYLPNGNRTAASLGGWDSSSNDQRSTMKLGDLKALGTVLSTVFQGGSGRGILSSSELAQEEKHGREDGSPPEYVSQTSGDVGFTGWAKAGRRSKSPGSLSVDENDTDKNKQRKHTGDLGQYLPLYLSALISALLGDKTEGGDSRGTASSTDISYESAKDVYLDLKVMKEDEKECFRKVYPDECTINGHLRLQGGLFYGRQVQTSMLLNLVQSSAALGGQPLMATISGYPGTGKSTLVNQVKHTLSDKTHWIGAKFENGSARPDFILMSALDSFFGRILEDNTNHHLHTSMRWRIEFAIGSVNSSAIYDVLPNLRTWLTEGSEDNVSPEDSNEQSKLKGTLGSSHRLKFMICKLIGAIACNVKPLVLFLDDIQWADETTLDIIRMVLTDPDTKHFIFLGSYRDNEVQEDHPLTAKLSAIRDQNIRLVPVQVGPIERDFVTTMISELMCLPPSLCTQLATLVHSKTGGVILFILRFLASLCDEGLMWYSLNSRRWCCDLNKIRQKQIESDVVALMRSHMNRLHKKTQMCLMIASCLGPRFDFKTFDRANKKSKSDGSDPLETCVDKGFLQTTGRESEREYVWCHDQIQQAAYELIPISKRPSFHLLLGSRLFMKTPAIELDRAVFIIVDMLNRGSSLIDDQTQKYEVAQLNLRAGETSLMTSAFQSAVKYLMRGISLLDSNSWEDMYELTIKLYDAASKALFVTGEFTMLSTISEKPLVCARSFEDKLNIYNNVVRALAATAKFDEGIETCIFVLSQLGIDVPTKINLDVYQTEVFQVKQLVAGKSENDILSLPLLLEKQKLAAMQFLNHLLLMAFSAKPRMNPIIVFRMIKISLLYGVCNISAFAFGCYGAWLVSESRFYVDSIASNPGFDVESGYRMGKVAVQMMKRLDAAEMTPRVYTIVYSFINIWKEPWQALLDKHLEAFSIGAKTGDLEYAVSAYYQHCNAAIYGCGVNLELLSQTIPAHAKWAFPFNRLPHWRSLVILNQLALDLMGIEQNAFVPYKPGMTEESCLKTARQNNDISTCRFICHKRKYSAFLRGDMEAAANMYDICDVYNQSMGPTGRIVQNIVGIFIDGLIGFFFAKTHRKDKAKWAKIGQDATQTMRTWTLNCSEWNFSNKLFLLEAESFYLQEDHARALACYHAAIKAARDHRFIHEEGLACEKLATFLLQQNRYREAMAAFADAKLCYESWRAHVLVKRIEKAMEQLMPLVTTV